MDRRRGVDTVKGAGPGQQLLAGAILLGGTPQQLDPAARVLDLVGHREERADGDGRDDVVPAAVPDSGQRVVLLEHRHPRSARARRGPQRGRQAADPDLDVVTLAA